MFQISIQYFTRINKKKYFKKNISRKYTANYQNDNMDHLTLYVFKFIKINRWLKVVKTTTRKAAINLYQIERIVVLINTKQCYELSL